MKKYQIIIRSNNYVYLKITTPCNIEIILAKKNRSRAERRLKTLSDRLKMRSFTYMRLKKRLSEILSQKEEEEKRKKFLALCTLAKEFQQFLNRHPHIVFI